MNTANSDLANEFSKLPYEKKVCFVPFESDKKSIIHVELCNRVSKPIYEIVIGMATGRYLFYNVFDLLEKGEINSNIKLSERY